MWANVGFGFEVSGTTLYATSHDVAQYVCVAAIRSLLVRKNLLEYLLYC